MISFRVARVVWALAAMVGVAGLSILPAEHVHAHADQASASHGALVHRHFEPHHPSAPAHAQLHDAHDQRPDAHDRLHVGDDDEHQQTIQVVFTTAARADRCAAPVVALLAYRGHLSAPTPAVTATCGRAPPPYTSPPAPAPSLRGPPVTV